MVSPGWYSATVADLAVFQGGVFTGSPRPPKCLPQNFKHYFSKSLQLQLSILLPHWAEALHSLFTWSVLCHSKSAEKAFATGAPPWTRLMELMTADPYTGIPNPQFPSLSTPSTSRYRRLISVNPSEICLRLWWLQYLLGQRNDQGFESWFGHLSGVDVL